jgi:hypothetical protein
MVRGSSKVGANRRWQTSMLLTVARLVSQSKFIFQQDRLPVIVHHQKKQTRCLPFINFSGKRHNQSAIASHMRL